MPRTHYNKPTSWTWRITKIRASVYYPATYLYLIVKRRRNVVPSDQNQFIPIYCWTKRFENSNKNNDQSKSILPHGYTAERNGTSARRWKPLNRKTLNVAFGGKITVFETTRSDLKTFLELIRLLNFSVLTDLNVQFHFVICNAT